MRLYEINNKMRQCLEDGFDIETGEIADETFLESLNLERTEKIEGCVCYIKELAAEETALKAEEENLAKRRRQVANRKASLLAYVEHNVEPGEKIETARMKLTWRRSTSVLVDMSILPKQWQKVTYTPDKVAIKEALKKGEEIEGAELEEHLGMGIK